MDLQKANYKAPFKNLRENASRWPYMPYHADFRAIEMPIILKFIISVRLFFKQIKTAPGNIIRDSELCLK